MARGGTSKGPAYIRHFLANHVIEPWAGRFFADLERAQAAAFYRSVGTLGRVFVEIETEAFALAA